MRVTVDLGRRAYDVVLGAGVRAELAALIQERAPRAREAVVITSPSLRAQPWFNVETGLEQHVIEVPDGEAAKSWSTLESISEELAARRLSRHDVIVGVGGGAITDLAGFVASIYLRGVGVVHLPTSLVGQVDAAIGGKTAVNLRAGKNLVGAIHQPLGVLCDSEVLATLPERDRRGGLAEVAKCWLLEDRRASDLNAAPLEELILLAVRLKAGIVMMDETEVGQRALLNYGHTLGHALEILALERDRDEMRHGEAVAIGLGFAVRLAHAMGRVGALEVANHDDVLASLGLSWRLPEYASTDALIRGMAHDKKAHHDLTFVLPGAAGFEVVHHVPDALVRDVIEKFRGET